jgi:hypothetical protein
MRLLVVVVGVGLLAVVLRDAFETIILPRRVRRRFQLTRIFYRVTWTAWRNVVGRPRGAFAEHALGWYGPFSVLLLLALWAVSMIVGFGMLQWGIGEGIVHSGKPVVDFWETVYFSGSSFFTLGLGDVVPVTPLGKILTVTEAGLGFAFLAIVVGYLPVMYQAFSRREQVISLLDARAGSPPAVGELLRRHGPDPDHRRLEVLLTDWERWSGEVLETHLSYAVLAYFRSQHGNQSWLATLTVVLDTSAIASLGTEGPCRRQAELTFAMARHAVVDLAQVFRAREPERIPERLADAEMDSLREAARAAGLAIEPGFERRLEQLRSLYEPYLAAISQHLSLPLPRWLRISGKPDNWETAPWKPHPRQQDTGEHFMQS